MSIHEHGRATIRGNLHSGERKRADTRPMHYSAEDEPRPQQHFVPTFTVVRPVIQTEEIRDFHDALTNEFEKRHYRGRYAVRDIGRLGVTQVYGNRIREAYREADVQPAPERMVEAVKMICHGLKDTLEGTPRTLEFYPGNLYAYGKRGLQLGYTSLGWKGYKTYPESDKANGTQIPNFNAQTVREHNVSSGAIANTLGSGIDGNGNYRDDIKLGRVCSNPPHLTVAKKNRGNKLNQAELTDLQGVIDDIYERSVGADTPIHVFDPIIHLALGRNSTETERIVEQYGLGADLAPDFVSVRRIGKREFGGLLPRQYFQGDPV